MTEHTKKECTIPSSEVCWACSICDGTREAIDPDEMKRGTMVWQMYEDDSNQFASEHTTSVQVKTELEKLQLWYLQNGNAGGWRGQGGGVRWWRPIYEYILASYLLHEKHAAEATLWNYVADVGEWELTQRPRSYTLEKEE
jgi:hypothetical protein